MEITKEFFEEWNYTDSTLQSDLPSHLTAEMKGYDQRNGYNAVGRWVVSYRERPTKKGEWIVPPFISTEIGMISGGENVGYKIISSMNPNCPTGKDSYDDFACDVIDTLYNAYLATRLHGQR